MECPVEVFKSSYESCHFVSGSYDDCANASRCFQLMGGCKEIKINHLPPKESYEESLRCVHEALGVG